LLFITLALFIPFFGAPALSAAADPGDKIFCTIITIASDDQER
jgi:hypothetical protein